MIAFGERSHPRSPAAPAILPAVQFAYITGWRIPSEVLPMQWRHVDFEARVVRLDPHTTKNDEGRTFPFTDAVHGLLEAQKAEHDRLRADGIICPWVSPVFGRICSQVVPKFRGSKGRRPHRSSCRSPQMAVGFAGVHRAFAYPPSNC